MKKSILLLVLILNQISMVNAQWASTYGAISSKTVTCIAISGSNIFAGTTNSGVYLSSDNGGTWAAVNSGLSNLNVNSIVINGSNIFAGTYGGGVFLSTNNGGSWIAKNSGITDLNIVAMVVKGTNIFACSNSPSGGVYLSLNNGTSWSQKNSGMTIYTLKSIAANTTNLFVSGYPTSDVLTSTNDASLWTPTGSGTSATVTCLCTNGTYIYAGSDQVSGGGLYMSSDNGGSWFSIATGSGCGYVQAMLIYNSKLFVGGGGNSDECLSMTTAYPSTWTTVDNGLPSSNSVTALAVNSTYMFAGVTGNGVWKRSLTEFVGIDENFSNNTNTISILPNTAQDMITIEDNAFSKDKNISIYNIGGQLLSQLPMQQPKTEINTSSLAMGVYIIKVNSNEGIAVKKFIKE
jgi:hypothetical protein